LSVLSEWIEPSSLGDVEAEASEVMTAAPAPTTNPAPDDLPTDRWGWPLEIPSIGFRTMGPTAGCEICADVVDVGYDPGDGRFSILCLRHARDAAGLPELGPGDGVAPFAHAMIEGAEAPPPIPENLSASITPAFRGMCVGCGKASEVRWYIIPVADWEKCLCHGCAARILQFPDFQAAPVSRDEI